jgi:hypothetical protein
MQVASSGFSNPMRVVPLSSLLLVGTAVLVVHLLVLQGTAFVLNSSVAPITRPFITRTLPSAPAAPAVAHKPAPAKRIARKAPPPVQPVQPAATLPADPPPADTSSSAASDIAAAVPPEPAASAPATDTPATPPAPPVAQAAPLPSVNVPGSLRLLYRIEGEIQKLTYHASGELLWLHDGKTYDARLEVGAFLLGSRVQTSSGRITPEGLAPTRFGDKVRSEVAAHFERDKGKVIFSANTPDVALQPGAQDQLSIFIQIASLLAADPARYPKGTLIEMQAVGARDSDTWSVIVENEEVVQLPGGDLRALKISRAPQKDYDLNVELWLAPSLGYLPVRIRLTQKNGDFIDQQLRKSELP